MYLVPSHPHVPRAALIRQLVCEEWPSQFRTHRCVLFLFPAPVRGRLLAWDLTLGLEACSVVVLEHVPVQSHLDSV